MKFSHKKLIIVLLGVLYCFSYNLAKAEVKISEFVSRPSIGSEWVELSSTDLQNLSGWSLTELANPGKDTQHENTPKDLTGLIIPAGGVLAIDFSGLNDTGDAISLYNGATLVSRVSYGIIKDFVKNLDAPDIDKSGALISNVWQTNQEPTKGALNPIPHPVATGGLPANDTGNSFLSSNIVVVDTKNRIPEEIKIQTKINAKEFGFVGLPINFKATTYGIHGEQLRSGKYFWNFGDGDSKEISATESAPLPHTYFYPREYTVSLDYFSSNYFQTEVPDATTQVTIKIIPAQIIISRVGEDPDFFVEIANQTDYPVDLSNYYLSGETKNFYLPRNTILSAKKSIIISPKITNLSSFDKSYLKFMTPGGEVAYDFGASLEPAQTFVKNSAPKIILSNENKNQNINLSSVEAPENNLAAAVIQSDAQNSNNTHSKIIFVIFTIFLVISAGGVYFVRSRGSIQSYENDFEILDE